MPVNKKEVEHIASLARLKFNDEELEKLTVHFNRVLNYMNKLNEVNTDEVEPLLHPSGNVNVMREDIQVDSPAGKSILKNAPGTEDEFFKVPKVIGGR